MARFEFEIDDELVSAFSLRFSSRSKKWEVFLASRMDFPTNKGNGIVGESAVVYATELPKALREAHEELRTAVANAIEKENQRIPKEIIGIPAVTININPEDLGI